MLICTTDLRDGWTIRDSGTERALRSGFHCSRDHRLELEKTDNRGGNMYAKASAGLCAAAVLAIGVAASAQQPAPAQTPPASRTSTDQQVTLTGCIQKEADFRQARDAGRGGVAGTGVGAGNEFILAQASASSSPSAAARPGDPPSPTGTAGSAASAYELTGPNEGKVSEFVGKRVEITGRVKAAEADAAGRPTGGATAGQPPAGIDATSKDLKLRELEVTSVRESTGSCMPIR
jgi:hypothetical protein